MLKQFVVKFNIEVRNTINTSYSERSAAGKERLGELYHSEKEYKQAIKNRLDKELNLENLTLLLNSIKEGGYAKYCYDEGVRMCRVPYGTYGNIRGFHTVFYVKDIILKNAATILHEHSCKECKKSTEQDTIKWTLKALNPATLFKFLFGKRAKKLDTKCKSCFKSGTVTDIAHIYVKTQPEYLLKFLSTNKLDKNTQEQVENIIKSKMIRGIEDIANITRLYIKHNNKTVLEVYEACVPFNIFRLKFDDKELDFAVYGKNLELKKWDKA